MDNAVYNPDCPCDACIECGCDHDVCHCECHTLETPDIEKGN